MGFMKRAFDLLALYEREVPGILPSVAQIPTGYVANEQTLARVTCEPRGQSEHSNDAERAGLRSEERKSPPSSSRFILTPCSIFSPAVPAIHSTARRWAMVPQLCAIRR